jgi:hypothetical protein
MWYSRRVDKWSDDVAAPVLELLVYEALSYYSLKLLVYEALCYLCMGPNATIPGAWSG